MDDLSKYAHSPAHLAVLQQDHDTLKQIVAALPKLAKAGDVKTEVESIAAEADAKAVSAVIDRRDVPGRETPLHLAVRLHDAVSAEILIAAGANWSLNNENGWSALQEAICLREENIVTIIIWHREPFFWAKWCRRLPQILASAARIRDFYMEITWHFESSVIPFISRVAPSDTYRIWKRGSNLRADTTLAGFDGLRIQRSDTSLLFLGEGHSSEDGTISLPPGSLIVLLHKKKEIIKALEGAGVQPSDAEIARLVASKISKPEVSRAGIDVSQAELVPQLNWRKQQKSEMVGAWKAKVYDMLHVHLSLTSKRVPSAVTGKELSSVNTDDRLANGGENEYEVVLTAEERKQLDSVRGMGEGLGEGNNTETQDDCHENFGAGSVESSGSSDTGKEKKSWFPRNKKNTKDKLAPDDSKKKSDGSHRSSVEFPMEDRKSKDKTVKKKKEKGAAVESKNEGQFKKGVRPILWLTPDFPLKIHELLPFLDILANQIKAVRRLRELLTTKLPPGTFPVKIAIPTIPTVRAVVTFTKFDDLPPEEFSTPPSSPDHFQDEPEGSSSWVSWIRSRGDQSGDSERQSFQDDVDLFHIPSDYAWIDARERQRRKEAKRAEARQAAEAKKAEAKKTESKKH